MPATNKAIDKVYLQRQLVHFNKDVSAQRYITFLSALPTPSIDVSDTPTYYDADQYKLYGNKVIQWVGAETTWGTAPNDIILKEGLFYKLNMSLVDGSTTEYELTSITAISKDFLVKSAKVVTATTNGGFWFKNVWYEYDDTWIYSEHTTDVPALPSGYSTIYKYANSSGDALYSEVDVTNLDSYDEQLGWWPHEVYSIVDNEWVSQGQNWKADFVEGWATASIIAANHLVIGKKYIDFVINSKYGTASDEHLYLALDDLVSNYTAGDGITISSDNIISLDLETVDITFNINDFS